MSSSAAVGRSIVLAVSGGLDSMVLLHAVSRALAAPGRGRTRDVPAVRVATFDHGTGPHATAGTAVVVAQAERLGLEVSVGRAEHVGRSEAEWRAARWTFLRSVCGPDGVVATGHSCDDHLETVVMRALRGAGARGLTGLRAPSTGVVRPFLELRRADIHEYAVRHRVPFVEDPSNLSRRHLRNRVRLDLLPAIERVRPGFGAEMLALAERAAECRTALDRVAGRFVTERLGPGSIRVAREELATYDSKALCVLWPAIAARAGVTLDRRGTVRLAQFTTAGASGAKIQLSGGVEVYRHREEFVFRHTQAAVAPGDEVPLSGAVEFGPWRFRPLPVSNDPDSESHALGSGKSSSHDVSAVDSPGATSSDIWWSDLPADRRLSVREWRASDRMRALADGSARRVKRFFGDAQVPGPIRAGWPVVLADDEIVWIPGVRRTRAASERSGRPVVRYACERVDGKLPSSR